MPKEQAAAEEIRLAEDIPIGANWSYSAAISTETPPKNWGPATRPVGLP